VPPPSPSTSNNTEVCDRQLINKVFAGKTFVLIFYIFQDDARQAGAPRNNSGRMVHKLLSVENRNYVFSRLYRLHQDFQMTLDYPSTFVIDPSIDFNENSFEMEYMKVFLFAFTKIHKDSTCDLCRFGTVLVWGTTNAAQWKMRYY
jgi:hypothetical protein